MRSQTFKVTLGRQEREELTRLAHSNKRSLRQRQHARILLLSDQAQGGGGLGDVSVARQVRCARATVGRVRKRCMGNCCDKVPVSSIVPSPSASISTSN